MHMAAEDLEDIDIWNSTLSKSQQFQLCFLNHETVNPPERQSTVFSCKDQTFAAAAAVTCIHG